MNSFQLGLCSVTFRKKSMEEITEIAAEAGIGYIEWGGDVHVRTIEDAKKAKEICDKNNIKISSYGSYFNAADYDEREWEKNCKITKEMAGESIRIWLGKKDSEKTDEEEYGVLLSNMKKMCDKAREYGLLVCPECHDGTFNNNTDAFLRIAKDLDKNNFKTYFQSRYFRMDYDLDRIDRTYPYIENVHVSYRDLELEQMFRKKDKNYLDTLLKTFLKKDFRGIVMVEFVSSDSRSQFMKDIEKLKAY